MNHHKPSAIILMTCKDQKGIVAKVAGFIHDHGGNILNSDHHTDQGTGTLLMRAEFELEGFTLPREAIAPAFKAVADRFAMWYDVHFSDERLRVGLLVSKQDHCVGDLLLRQRRGEMKIDIPVIISNHATAAMWGEVFHIPFQVFPVTKDTKQEQERHVVALLKQHQVNLVVLARYMQILSPWFLSEMGCPIINIHHSFLPAFAGAKPYRQAYERGVKIIGATAHYVREELDEGPIISQDVIRIRHRDTEEDLVRKGRDIEELVLARAVRRHSEHRVLVYGQKTVVFE